MASIPSRLMTPSPRLALGLTRFPAARVRNIHVNSRPACSVPSLLPSCRRVTPASGPAWDRSHYSTSNNACTLPSSDHSSRKAIQWTAQRQIRTIQRTPGIGGNVLLRGFASQQSGRDAKDEATPVASHPLTQPAILKKALNPTKHENIYTLPNFLTFSRLLAAPAIGYFIINSQPVIALALFFYAGVTDLVDGYLARRYNSQTVVGTILDPMADKTLMTVTVVCLGIQGLIPVWLAVIILGRDVGLAISATYYRYISLPPPKTFTRYWDFSLPSAEVRPTEISKINTLLQLLLVGNAMVLPVLPVALVEAWNLVGVFEGWQFLVAGTTIWSGLSYVFSNDAVKILSQEEQAEARNEGKKV